MNFSHRASIGTKTRKMPRTLREQQVQPNESDWLFRGHPGERASDYIYDTHPCLPIHHDGNEVRGVIGATRITPEERWTDSASGHWWPRHQQALAQERLYQRVLHEQQFYQEFLQGEHRYKQHNQEQLERYPTLHSPSSVFDGRAPSQPHGKVMPLKKRLVQAKSTVTSNSVMDFKEDTDSGMVLGTLEEAVSP